MVNPPPEILNVPEIPRPHPPASLAAKVQAHGLGPMFSIHSAYGLSRVLLESLRCFLFFFNWTLTGAKLRVQSESGHFSWHAVSKLDPLALPMIPCFYQIYCSTFFAAF